MHKFTYDAKICGLVKMLCCCKQKNINENADKLSAYIIFIITAVLLALAILERPILLGAVEHERNEETEFEKRQKKVSFVPYRFSFSSFSPPFDVFSRCSGNMFSVNEDIPIRDNVCSCARARCKEENVGSSRLWDIKDNVFFF